MTGTIAILTKPFAIKAEGKTITEEGKAQRLDPAEISQEEIRQRQRSMVNALLCCMI